MSRLMTIKELYSLLLHTQKLPSPQTLPHAKPERQVRVARSVLERMEQVATACGISPSEAWTEAASTWVSQRQRDMDELETPSAKLIKQSMHRIWNVIDAQMSELRER